MNLRDLLHIIARRWLLVLTGLVLTVGACLGLFLVVPVSYVAATSLVLLPPATVVQGGNPYLYLGGLSPALDVLTRNINADSVSAPIKKAHPDAAVEAYADASLSGPILTIEVTGPSAAEVLTVRDLTVAAVSPALVSLQDGLAVPAADRITTSSVAADEIPTEDVKTRIQAIGAAAALGIVLTLLLAAYRDGRLLARAARRNENPDPHTEASDTEHLPELAPGLSSSTGSSIGASASQRRLLEHPATEPAQ